MSHPASPPDESDPTVRRFAPGVVPAQAPPADPTEQIGAKPPLDPTRTFDAGPGVPLDPTRTFGSEDGPAAPPAGPLPPVYSPPQPPVPAAPAPAYPQSAPPSPYSPPPPSPQSGPPPLSGPPAPYSPPPSAFSPPLSAPPSPYAPPSGYPAPQPPVQAYSPPPPGYGPPGGYPPPYPPVVMAVAPPTSGWAVASLVLGIIGLLGGWCAFGIPCLLAVILGHIGCNETKRGLKSGKGLAVAGLVMGYICVVPGVLLTLWVFGAGAYGASFS